MNPKPTIQSIQALRGLAALLVVGFHFRSIAGPANQALADLLFSQGAIGVPLFFTISGFIVVYITEDHAQGLAGGRDFLVKRACRVLPLYYLVTLGGAGSSWDSLYETGRSMLFIPLGGTGGGPTYGYARLFVGWTLNYEIFFYLLTGLCIVVAGRWRWQVLLACLAALVLAPALYFGWNGLSTSAGYPFGNVYLAMITNPILLQFALGVLIGLWHRADPKRGMGYWGWGLAVAGPLFVWDYVTGRYNGHDLTGWGLICAALVLTLVMYERQRAVRWPPFLLFLGTISYSLYLMHEKVWFFCERLLPRLGIAKDTGGWPLLIAVAIVTLLVSMVTHKYIEQKLLGWMRAKLFGASRGGSERPRQPAPAGL
ncbi:acyltransferase [Crenobacter sp. SG2303]|uniref:Acyltransferase n=1 Tax=Crenobacter oryzisoli TaxID=3056844 RepID=A0ABT7XM21_9NEIS|nr:acyltransferase [Crenobacter sp. SG2303]MDN0074841.1 acyltransferase [Crenobacter sp. SG2303]